MSDDKINRFVMKRELKATSKQRKFYLILSGKTAPRGISRGELADIIATFPPEQIEKARKGYKEVKRASKYMRAMMSELEIMGADTACRKFAADQLSAFKRQNPDAFAKAKARLRGFTYAEE